MVGALTLKKKNPFVSGFHSHLVYLSEACLTHFPGHGGVLCVPTSRAFCRQASGELMSLMGLSLRGWLSRDLPVQRTHVLPKAHPV